MSLTRALLFVLSHAAAGAAGFALGIYALPILTAPPAPTAQEVTAVSAQAQFSGEFSRDLQDSDALHWGEGKVAVSDTAVSLMGNLAPGPDYKLYLSPSFVETEADFNRIRPAMQLVGDIRTFENFVVAVPPGINVSDFNTVIVWCESFGQFITAAAYQ